MSWKRLRKAMILPLLSLLTLGIAQSDNDGNANLQAGALLQSGALLSYDRADGHYRFYLADNIGAAESSGDGFYPDGTGASN